MRLIFSIALRDNLITQVLWGCAVVVFAMLVVGFHADRSEGAVVTQLDLTGGSIALDFGKLGPVSESFSRTGALVMNQFQPPPQIFDPVTVGHLTFSLFTADGGTLALPPPTGSTIGSTITVDLSSLFATVTSTGWGGVLSPPSTPSSAVFHIGAIASGEFFADTGAFTISWTKSLTGVPSLVSATFALSGTARLAEVPIPATVALFGSGLLGLGALRARHRARVKTGTGAGHA